MMQIRVLGASGRIDDGARTTTSRLVHDDMPIDPGASVGHLDLDAITGKDHVFLTRVIRCDIRDVP